MSLQIIKNLESISNNSALRMIYDRMMKDFYPKVSSINSRIALDLGFLYIYQNLETETEKEELVNFWRENSSPEIVQLPMGEFHYRPYIDFISLDKIMNGLYIETVLEQLGKFTKLTFYEACAILSDLERYYIVPLSEMDVKIIEAVKNQIKLSESYNNEILSNNLQVRANYISRRMGYLRNNAYFRVTGTVNFPKIGLAQYIILLESSLEYRDSIPEFFNSQYTRTIRRCPNQRFDYIISITLPKKVEHSLYDYLTKLCENNIIRYFYCDEVISISNNLDFTYYSYSKRPTVLSASKPGFHIDWFKERILTLSNNHIDQNGLSFHKFTFGGNKIDFTTMDLKILTLYRRDLDSSVRTISKRLGLSWDESNYHIERVKPLLFPMILLYYTGLNQTVLFFFEKTSEKQLESLESLLTRMPQAFSYSFKNGGAIVTVDLMNGAHRLNDLICESIPDLKTAQFSLASKTNGIFRPVPYRHYNELEKEWFFPNDFFLFKDIE